MFNAYLRRPEVFDNSVTIGNVRIHILDQVKRGEYYDLQQNKFLKDEIRKKHSLLNFNLFINCNIQQLHDD